MRRSQASWEKWKGIVAEQQASGLSVKDFCEQRGVAASSFFPWRRRVAAGPGAPTAPASFVEAKVQRAQPHGVDALGRDGDRVDGGRDDGGRREGGITIELAHGRRLLVGRGFDRTLLQEVIQALEPGPHNPGARS